MVTSGTPVWSSGDLCAGFQSQDGSPHVHALLPSQDQLPKFTSIVTLTGQGVVSMAGNPFTHIFIKVFV